ncbi:MAG TPA: 1,4-dihydroxy-2-naphthoate octaprenyltransferase [Crocinitomix sp.]|nr:1,4-dihydroxy-2-naphthoate octaprenyltransferase [Crocinitomix sp.]
MNKFKAWIKAFRLRTLPLSFSAILLGSSLVLIDNTLNFKTLTLILLTTLFLQILSNLANDYGDAQKGADNKNRLGPTRAIQSGLISLNEMKKAIAITSVLSLLSGLLLLHTAFKGHINIYFIGFFILGLLSIVAAIKYTVGKKAYGYSAKGDLFVFIFFGLVAVLGTYFLLSKQFKLLSVLPSITMGGFSVAVLNLNNMRDIENDKAVNKITIPVKIGLNNAKKYHYAIFFWSYLSYIIYAVIKFNGLQLFLMLLPLLTVAFVHFAHLQRIKNIKNPKKFDPELKQIALSALLFALLLFVITYLN